MAEWRWIRIFAEQFERCGLVPGEVVAVLSESSSRPELVETARLAAQLLEGQVFDLVVPTPVNDQPVAIRSTGASRALQGNPGVLAALSSAGLVLDCTVEGLLHAPELGAILDGGARDPDDLQRAPGELRALPVRPRAGRPRRAVHTPPSTTPR